MIQLQLLSSVWSWYNAPDALAPFLIPLTLWTTAYVYSQRSKCVPFHQWHFIHNIHNAGAIVLGLTSLYNHNDDRFNERIGIAWSLTYFLVDIYDCLVRRDVQYLLHGVLCWTLGVANYLHPVCRLLRTNSRAALCEFSNPVMHYAKRTRTAAAFGLFVAVFTACRIVWIPVMMMSCRQAGMAWTHPVLLAVTVFYALNWYWYVKMLQILIKGPSRTTTKRIDKEE